MFKKTSFSVKLFAGVLTSIIAILTTSGVINIMTAQSGLQDQGIKSLLAKSETVISTFAMQEELIGEKLNADLILVDYFVTELGTPNLDYSTMEQETVTNQASKQQSSVNIPSLRFGSEVINHNFSLVDSIQKMVGGTATVFQVVDNKLLRISTNVKKLDGQRATGTYIPSNSPVYKSVMAGRTFYGKAFVVNAWYQTAYKPLKDSEGNIVSVVYVGRKILSDTMLGFFQQIANDSGAGIYIYNSKGEVLVDTTRRFKGKNIFDFPHGDLLKDDSTEIIRYRSDNDQIKKVAANSYFQPWDFHLVIEKTEKHITGGIEKKLAKTTLLSIIFGIIISSLCLLVIIRIITKPLQELAEQTEKVVKGDYDISFNYAGNDAIGKVGHSFKSMVKNLKEVMAGISSGVNQLSSSSSELTKTANEINNNAGATADTVTQVTGASESMSQAVNIVASAMEETSVNMQTISTAAEELSSTIEEISNNTENAQNIVTDAVSNAERATEKVNALDNAARKINKVTEVITEIAEQTNLLALNATIEAARAGEAGKGFSVVANEIKELAAQTADATKEIKDKIASIQSVTADTIGEINGTSHIISDISKMVNIIAEAVQRQTATTQEISHSLGEMAAGVSEATESISRTAGDADQVVTEMETVKAMSMQITSSGREVLQASQSLNELAGKLDNMTNKYAS